MSQPAISLRQMGAGPAGKSGYDGWTPIFAMIADGDRRVQQIIDWTGGQGSKPIIGWFVGPLGPVETIAEATDIRGETGPVGPAAALGDDANISATVTAALAARLKLDGSTPMEGDLNLGGFNLTNALNLVGQVAWFAASSPPTGWLKANGAAVSRATYANLFAKTGTSFGVGDGSTTFNLPDLRGEFVRGLDDGRGVDAGRTLGSFQSEALQPHTHGLVFPVTQYIGDKITGGNVSAVGPGHQWASNQNFPSSTGSSGSPETRPRNVALLACVRY